MDESGSHEVSTAHCNTFEALIIIFLQQEDIHKRLSTVSDMNPTDKPHGGNLARPTFHPISTVYS